MLRIPVIILEKGKKVGSLEVEKSEIYDLKQEAFLECKEKLNWAKKSPKVTHVVYYEESVGMRGGIQSITIYKGGTDFTEDAFNELIHKPYVGYVGAIHKQMNGFNEKTRGDLTSLANILCDKILENFDNPTYECTVETASDPSSDFYNFLKEMPLNYRNDIIIERALECVSKKLKEKRDSFMESVMRNPFGPNASDARKNAINRTRRVNEGWVRSFKRTPVCFVVKDLKGKYCSYDSENDIYDFTDNLDLAEAFDSKIEAEDTISEIIDREIGEIDWDDDRQVAKWDEEQSIKSDEYKVVPIYGDNFHESNTKIERNVLKDTNDFLMDCIEELYDR